MAVKPGLCGTWSETPKTGFLTTRLIFLLECEPEVYLPFDKDTNDKSGNSFYVGNENVRVVNGVAKFNGRSRLIIPRFTNLEHSTTVVIKVKFTSSASAPTVARALVSNSDCGNLPSIMISEDDDNIYFGVGTSSKAFEFTSIPREVRILQFYHILLKL